jgi:hypothetical protein
VLAVTEDSIELGLSTGEIEGGTIPDPEADSSYGSGGGSMGSSYGIGGGSTGSNYGITLE